jgi:hypothetical protein
MTTSADFSDIAAGLQTLHLFDNKERCIEAIVNHDVDSLNHVLDAGLTDIEESP